MRCLLCWMLLTRDGHLHHAPLLRAIASPDNVQIPVHPRSGTTMLFAAHTGSNALARSEGEYATADTMRSAVRDGGQATCLLSLSPCLAV